MTLRDRESVNTLQLFLIQIEFITEPSGNRGPRRASPAQRGGSEQMQALNLSVECARYRSRFCIPLEKFDYSIAISDRNEFHQSGGVNSGGSNMRSRNSPS